MHIGIGKETVRGIYVSPEYWLPKMEFSCDDKIEQVVNESSYGVIDDASDASATQQYAEGSIKGRIEVDTFGLLLLSTLGEDTPTLVETGVYSHVFGLVHTAQHPSFSLYIKDPNVSGYDSAIYSLGMIDTMEINAEIGKYVEYTAKFKANSTAVDDTTAPSYENKSFFLPQNAEFKLADNLAGLAGATAISVKKVNFTISKNIEDDIVIGNYQALDRMNKHFAVEGTVELSYDNRNIIDDYFMGDVPQAMRLKLISNDTMGAVSKPTLIFDFAKVKFSEVARTMDNNDFVKQTLSFKSFYSADDSKSLEVTLQNEVASY